MNKEDNIILIFEVLNTIRSVDSNITVSHVLVLLTVALSPGCSPGDLIDEIGISSASAARLVVRLSNWEMLAIKGMGLISSEMDPFDRRKRSLHLTAEGQRLISRIREVFL
jgi:DNA-binding MarR family transcriptional regulator